jgi:hypothetical protein
LSTVYRILDGNMARKKYGAGLKRLCEFANVPIEVIPPGDVPPTIRKAVLETWDGTAAHANRLARAIRTLGEVTSSAVLSK